MVSRNHEEKRESFAVGARCHSSEEFALKLRDHVESVGYLLALLGERRPCRRDSLPDGCGLGYMRCVHGFVHPVFDVADKTSHKDCVQEA